MGIRQCVREMGGTKKKTLASMEKSQDDSATSVSAGDEKGGKKKSEKAKVGGERKRVDVLFPRMSDQEVMKSLGSLRAITIYGAAKSLSVNAAVAKAVISSMESKGLVRRAGGFSGHYVWAPAAS
jgi:small subunit ribosomal protein S25e